MQTSVYNNINNTGVTASSTSLEVAGKGIEKLLLQDSNRKYSSVGDIDGTISNLGSVNIQFIALFNVTFDASITIEAYDSGMGLLGSETFTTVNVANSRQKHVIWVAELSGVDSIRVFTGAGTATTGAESKVGYLWAGDWLNLGCPMNAQPETESADVVQMSRTNTPDSQARYWFRSFSLTFAFETWVLARTAIEQIISDGYGKPRPWYFNEYTNFQGELYYAIKDSPRDKYDIQYGPVKDSKFTLESQPTIGIREVT